MSDLICAKCGHAIPLLGVVGRRDECSKCHSDLHSCVNCIHYDSKAYNECREPVADRVQEKDRANFCDQFAPGSGGAKKAPTQAELFAAAEALFKKK